MHLLIIYVVLMIAGDFLDYFIGLFVEAYWPSASLPIFLALYFIFLWISWEIAVRITKPGHVTAGPATA